MNTINNSYLMILIVIVLSFFSIRSTEEATAKPLYLPLEKEHT